MRALADALLARRLTLVTAESCTGGWIAKACTDQPGSSQWYEYGLVTYSNAAKQDCLGVTDAILNTHGAVSQACAQAMAHGAQAQQPERVTIAVTGVAGPGGGTDDKPVGQVWLAWALPNGGIESAVNQFAGDRQAIRRQSVIAAITGLIARLPASSD